MKNKTRYRQLIPLYVLLIIAILSVSIGGSRAITVLSMNQSIKNRSVVVIDPGHGGVDGGATSYTGVLESNFNLEIAKRLNDLMHLLGIKTMMIRNGDYSVYTNGSSIAEKKISDLKERVRIVNSTNNAILISIHQNYFNNSKYRGAQVFYSPTHKSRELALELQNLMKKIDPSNHRQIKKTDGIYLMQNISCPGVLVECGFISNPEEEALLLDESYQKKICSVIACVCSTFLNGEKSVL